MRGALPELADDPAPEQMDAWVELAETVQDDDARAAIRRAAADQARQQADGAGPAPEDARRVADLLQERTAEARQAGIEPASPEARPVVGELASAYAALAGRTDGPEFRSWLLDRLEKGHDPRYERYWQLLAVINGRPVAPTSAPAVTWLTEALRAT